MSRNLRLQVMLNAVDRVTGPLKRMRQSAGKTGQAMRETRDQLKTLQATQKDISSFRTLKNQSTATARAMREQQERIRRLSHQMQANQGDTTALANERRKAILQARQLSQRYDSERQKLQRLRSSLNNSGISTHNLSQDQQRLANEITQANQKMEAQKQKLKQLAEQQRRAAQASDRYQNGMGRVARAQGMGMGMLGTGMAQGYAAARLLTPGVAFGESMSGVQALTRLDADDERFQALKQQARELGSTTAFSATQAADAQSFLAMAGFDAEAIQAAMPDMLNLALANKTDLARTADISSNILSGFGLDPSEMQRVSDVLTATTTRANVDLSMLGESMKYVAPQAKAMNMSLEQSAAMAGLLGNVGIQGSQAGTTLRAMVTRLAAPTGAAAGALDELGINAKDAQGNLRDIPNILSDVARATENMGNADQAGFLKAIFGEEPGAGMAELIAQQGTEGIEAFVELLSNSMGEAARVAKTRADNIGGDLKGLRSAWEDVGISITETTKGPIRYLIQNITKVTRSVSAWIQENPELAGTIAKVAAAMIALATIGGAVTMTVASILSPLLFARFAMSTLGIQTGALGPVLKTAGAALFAVGKALTVGLLGALKATAIFLATNPIGWAILAIAATALVIYKYWEPIKGFFLGLWQQVKDAFGDGIGGVTRLLVNWSPLGLLYSGISSALGRLGIELPGSLSELGSKMIGGLSSGMSNALGWVRQSANSVWSAVNDAFGDGIGGVSRLLINWSPLGLLYSAFTSTLERLGISVPENFRSLGTFIIDGLIGGVAEKLGALRERITSIATGIKDWFKGVLGIHSPSRVFAEFGVNIVEGMINGIGSMIGALRDQVMGMAGNIAGWVQDAMGSALDSLSNGARRAIQLGKETAAGLGQGIRDGANRATESAANLASNVTSTVRGWLDIHSPSRVFATIGGYISQGLANGIEDDADGPVKQVRSIASHMRDAAAGLILGAGVASPTLAFEIQTPTLPPLPTLVSEVATPDVPKLETPTLDVLHIERPELPALPELGALQIQLPTLPAMPTLYSEVATPNVLKLETPTLDALHIQRPELPTLSELGALEIQRPALPAMPTLYSEVATPDVPRLETPTLDALHIERPELPALPELDALEIQRPTLPAMPTLYSEVATPETPTLNALAFEWPELPQFDPLQVDTSGVQIDARPPLQSHASQPNEGGLVINGGINIEIHAAPGMDEQALARLVNAEVQRALRDAERRAQARHRSAFHDID